MPQLKNIEPIDLTARAKAQLTLRLSANHNFTENEIAEVSELSHRLLPKEVKIGEKTTQRLRTLCSLSQCSLEQKTRITSHRPIVGPLVVALKRLTWPFVKAQLKDTFRAQEEFNSLMVETVAKEIVARHQTNKS